MTDKLIYKEFIGIEHFSIKDAVFHSNSGLTFKGI